MIYYGLTSLTSFGFPKNTQKSVPQILFQMNNSDRLNLEGPGSWWETRGTAHLQRTNALDSLPSALLLQRPRSIGCPSCPGVWKTRKGVCKDKYPTRVVWTWKKQAFEGLMMQIPNLFWMYSPENERISTWKLMLGRLYYTFPGEMVPFQGTFTFVFRWKNRWKNLQHHHLFFSRSSGTFPSSFFASSLSALSFSFGTSFKRAAFTFSFS